MADEQITPGAAGALPSLADLDNDLSPEQIATQAAAVKAEADLQAKRDEEARVTAEAEAKKNEGKTPEVIAAEKEAADKEAATQAAEEEARKKEEAADADAIATAEAFYEEVNKRHGFTDLKVEYGNVDPGSIDGLYMREKAIIERSQLELDAYLKKSDPRAYAYIVHRNNGGNDEEFFAKPTISLPEFETFKANTELQKQVLTRDLKNQGMDPEYIPFVIEKAEKDGKLLEKAEKSYKAINDGQDKELKAAEAAAQARELAEQRVVKGMVDTIADVITNNKTEQFQIPDTKKAAFNEYLKQHLMFDGENFYITKPVKSDSLSKLIEHEYFAFVNGNLSELVKRRADTARTTQFRLGAKKTEVAPKGKEGASGNQEFVPLSEI